MADQLLTNQLLTNQLLQDGRCVVARSMKGGTSPCRFRRLDIWTYKVDAKASQKEGRAKEKAELRWEEGGRGVSE